MINIDQPLIEHIEKSYDKKISQVIPVNSVLKVITSDRKVYVLKKIKNKEIIDIYHFLLSQKFVNFILPEVTVYKQLFTNYNNQFYYLIPWYEDIDYPIEKKLIDYIDLLYKLHKSTTIVKNFNKTQFNRIYKRMLKQLERQFHILDLYLIECENKDFKSVFEWTYLVKYNELMYIKNLLIKIQSQIDDLVENIDKYDYCIIHNNSSIDHFVVTNDKNYLISFDHSTIGFKVHDYIKLFIDYSEYDVDWLTLIINDNITPFEFYYFIFSVLFYIIKNINVTFLGKNNNFESINILVQNLFVCNRAIELYQKYETLNSSTEKQD